MAAETALQRHAYPEAIRYARKGLVWLARESASPEVAKHELSLQMTLALALVSAEGYASHELVTAYQCVRDLAAHSKSATRRFWVLMGLHDFHATRGEFVVTREIAEDVMRLADVTADPAIRFSGHLLLGYNAYCRGELAEARRHFDYEAGASDTSSSSLERIPFLTYRGLLFGTLGYPEQAEAELQRAVQLAEKQAHPFLVAYCLSQAGRFYLDHNMAIAYKYAERALQVASDYRLTEWYAYGLVLHGRVLAGQGHYGEGIAHLREGLSILLASGAMILYSTGLSWLAWALWHHGQAEEALQVLDEALHITQDKGLPLSVLQLWLLKGEIFLDVGRARMADSRGQ